MTSISKNVYIDKFVDIVIKYNNAYHRTIKIKPADVNPSTYIDLNKKIISEVLKLKLLIMLEYQTMKTFLQKAMFQIGLKKFL